MITIRLLTQIAWISCSDPERHNDIVCVRCCGIDVVYTFQVVVVALLNAIPSISQVCLVCVMLWLIFSIIGVQLFSGKFYKCLDPEGNTCLPSEVANKSQCLALEHLGYQWKNSMINFDNALIGFLGLFQVVSEAYYPCTRGGGSPKTYSATIACLQ